MAKQEMKKDKSNTMSTQAHLDVAEIREGTVVLRDGSLRAIIVVSSTNFSLKSGDEQNALIDSYQSFLNALDFPIQILMQSRKMDIHSYLDKLRGYASPNQRTFALTNPRVYRICGQTD
jgi:type IV secretory pathway VirB4 component